MNIRSILSITAAVAALSAPSFAIDIVAHRGASHAAPENTVSAIKLAWVENADGTEVDVYFTRDKKVMICHDGTTGRTSDYNLEIQKSTFAQLRCLDFGSWKDPKYKGEKMPTLQEALAAVPKDKKIYVELKSTDFEMVPVLEKILDVSGKRKNVVFISFGYDVLAQTKKTMPDRPCYWLLGGEIGNAKNVTAKAKAADFDGLDVHSSGLNAESVTNIRAAGLSVHAWTVDNGDEARRLRALKVDSITTNTPAYLRDELKK